MVDGRRLRRERQRQALGVAELAALVGLSGDMLSGIEQGAVRAGADDLNRLAAALGVEPHDIENAAHRTARSHLSSGDARILPV